MAFDEINEEEAIGILFLGEVAAEEIRIQQVRVKRPSFPKQVEKLSYDQIRDKVRYLVAKKNWLELILNLSYFQYFLDVDFFGIGGFEF